MIYLVKENERLIVERLGKHHNTRGPGLVFTVPLIDRVRKIDISIQKIAVNNSRIGNNKSIAFRIDNPEKAIYECEDYEVVINKIIEEYFKTEYKTQQNAEVIKELSKLLLPYGVVVVDIC